MATLPISQKLTRVGTTPGPSMEISVDRLGPPGILQQLHVLAVTAHETRSDSARLTDRGQRTFKIVAILAKAPSVNEHIKGDLTPDDGASYIVAPQKKITIETSLGRFHMTANQAGELSYIEYECETEDVISARYVFQRTVLPTLDHWSYLNNCPILIDRISYHDVKNCCYVIDFVGPYRKNPVSQIKAVLHEKMRPVYSLYREAQNSFSDFYKFLCYYKILEGLLITLRADYHKTLKDAGITRSFPRQVVPSHPELVDDWRQHVGKPLKKFFDDILTPEFRNAVAHFGIADQSILDMSDPGHIAKYSNTILIIELCARCAIADHESALASLI